MDEQTPGTRKESYAEQSGVNYANEAPRKIKRRDAAFIDNQLKNMFIRGHAMNVHNNHMSIVRTNAQLNTRRKVP